MRIVSKFRDFYDSVQQYGQDDLVYIRTPKIVEERGFCNSNEVYVGFAGKIYPILSPIGNSTRFLPRIEDVDKYVESAKDSMGWPSYDKNKKRFYYESDERGYLNGRSNIELSRANLVRWFANNPYEPPYRQDRADWHRGLTKLFDRHKVPIFVVRSNGLRTTVKVELNACLRPLNVAKVLPPFQAFQELSMWLSNQARPLKEPPKVDDKTMAEIKGFDKFSFRKPKRVI